MKKALFHPKIKLIKKPSLIVAAFFILVFSTSYAPLCYGAMVLCIQYSAKNEKSQ